MKRYWFLWILMGAVCAPLGAQATTENVCLDASDSPTPSEQQQIDNCVSTAIAQSNVSEHNNQLRDCLREKMVATSGCTVGDVTPECDISLQSDSCIQDHSMPSTAQQAVQEECYRDIMARRSQSCHDETTDPSACQTSYVSEQQACNTTYSNAVQLIAQGAADDDLIRQVVEDYNTCVSQAYLNFQSCVASL